jgi:hypothetical protein
VDCCVPSKMVNPSDIVLRRHCFLVDISNSICEYTHRLSSRITCMHYVVMCVVDMQYARKVLYESRNCHHVLICDGLCCLYKGYTRVVIKHGHLCS